jgi:peptidylprolyl isomerase/peptidyl-prolyl cis-trans isomerase B (cyclophilin B)
LTFCAVLFSVAQEYVLKPGETVVKIVVEGRGEIYIKFHVKEAPKTTSRILKLVRDGFYDGQRFHKVERSPRPYLVEAGDPQSRTGVDARDIGHGSTGTRIAYEDSGFLNEEGAVGLAHSVDDRDSGDCQFYMLLTAAKWLDGDYTVFGKVVAGMDVLRKIQKGDKIVSMSVIT